VQRSANAVEFDTVIARPGAARWRSSHQGTAGGRASATAIYFLLHPGEESRWHVVRSAELWFWHRGGPLELSLGGAGDAPGDPVVHLLGPDVASGQQPQALVPPGVWQAARPVGPEPALVSPGFDFADFRLA
jgi:uncharacterized protein